MMFCSVSNIFNDFDGFDDDGFDDFDDDDDDNFDDFDDDFDVVDDFADMVRYCRVYRNDTQHLQTTTNRKQLVMKVSLLDVG